MQSKSLQSRLTILVVSLTFSLSTVFAQHIITTVSVGDEPRGVAVNAYTGRVYVANVHSGTISVVRAGSVMDTLPVDTLPYVVAINHKTNRIYPPARNLLTRAVNLLVVIDAPTKNLHPQLPLN